MRIAVVILCALCSASTNAQEGRGTPPQAAPPPPPPATETVAPGIPGVVAAGAKVAIVKDGFQSSEGPILMPDGTTLFTEPGASKVHKIDKNGTISTFVENTGRANGLALDSKGRLIATTALTIEVLHPPSAKAVLAKMSTRPNDSRRRQERRRLFHAAERQAVSGLLHSVRRAGHQAGRSSRRARHSVESG